ncbi:MAG: AAA family ATPase [Lentisphaerota bacterium]
MDKAKKVSVRRRRLQPGDVRLNQNIDRFMGQMVLRFLKNMLQHSMEKAYDVDMFSPIQDFISRAELQRIVRVSTTAAIRQEMEKSKVDFHYDPAKHILTALWNHPKSNYYLRTELVKLIEKYMADNQKCKESLPCDPVQTKFEELRQFFKLDDREYDVLLLTAAAFIWRNDELRGSCSALKISKMESALGVAAGELAQFLKPDAKLRRYNCIDNELNLNNDLTTFISGLDDQPLTSRYFKIYRDETLPWNFYGDLGSKHGELLKKLLNNRLRERGMNILLYGAPGTGKTSFAFSLAAELGLTAYNVAQSDTNISTGTEYKDNSDYSASFRFAALQICDSQADNSHSLIIVDEADEMLAGESGIQQLLGGGRREDRDKGMLNSVLDSLKTPCIWIANTRAEMIAFSSRRRFDYSIKFNPLTGSQRRLIWRNAITKHKLSDSLPETLVDKLASNYEISAGGIDLALRNFQVLNSSEPVNPESAEQVMETFIKPHCELLGVTGSDQKRLMVAVDYSLDGLNLNGSIPLERIVAAVSRFRNEQNSSGQSGIDRPRMNMLLSGPPGTGKTEFVKYLGKTLDCKVLVKMGSDLLDKYVGGTEQNIREAFREAEKEKAILFLDEADGVLRSRQMAEKSWEVTQVNELLYQMENFNGVLICATNLTDRLDPATSRRFTFKMEFDYLTDEGKFVFFRKMLALLHPDELNEQERRRLLAIPNLTPGDFRTVRQGYYYLADEAKTNVYELFDALECESRVRKNYKSNGNAIGFMHQEIIR